MKAHWPVSLLSILSSLINMALPLILVRVLDRATLGSFKVFFLYLMVLPPLTFIAGVSSGLSYWAGRGQEGIKAIRVSGILFCLISLTSLLIMLLFQGKIASFTHVGLEWIHWFAYALFLSIAGMFYDDAAIATGRIWTGAFFNSGFEFLRTAVIVLTAIVYRDLFTIIKAHLIVQTLKVITGYALAFRQQLFRWEWDSKIFQSVVRYAFPVSLAWFFGLGLNYSDQIILSKILPVADFALYAVCCLSVPPLLVYEASVNRVLIPQLSEAFAQNDRARAATMFQRAVKELGFLMIPAVTGMIIFAEPIIELLFTKAYLSGAHFLKWYALWYLMLMVPQDVVARAQGQSRWILGNFISFSLITLGLCFGFGKAFGVMGVLQGLLIARLCSRAYTIYYLRKTLGWKLSDCLPLESFSRIGLHCIGLASICLLLKPWFNRSLLWLLVCGSGFAILYFMLTLKELFPPPSPHRRVLMLTPGLLIGGLERMILNLSKTLKKSALWQPRVLAYDFSSVPGRDLMGSFESFEIPVETSAKPARFSLRTVAWIAGRTSREQITVIHSHDLGALLYGALAKIFLGNRVKLIHTQHSFVHLNRSWKYRYYEKFFTRFADAIAVVSTDTKQNYLDLGIPEEKLHLIPNGVEFPENSEVDRNRRIQCRPDAKFKKDFWILYLARVHRRKGQDHALALWAELPEEIRKRSSLIFVGPETDSGELDRLKQIQENIPDSDRIQWIGASQHPHEWIQGADLFLSSSEFEGMPLSPVEAIGSGVPAVLSNIPGHEFLGAYSELYSLDRPHEGADKISKIIQQASVNDADLRRAWWERTQPLRDLFTLEAMSKHYERLYEGKS